MKIDFGMVVVIVAVLIFYLRLIILQRERAKRAQRAAPPPAVEGMSKFKAKRMQNAAPQSDYSILSSRPLDRAIAVGGMIAIALGALFYAGLFDSPALQSFWWLPAALGIIAFSWAFRLS
ncbi:MAG: hypothetical protein L0Z70_10520 [Chloroflexi bacterium]|nr:hypothetical protein [Chloroflexota bacterium]